MSKRAAALLILLHLLLGLEELPVVDAALYEQYEVGQSGAYK